MFTCREDETIRYIHARHTMFARYVTLRGLPYARL